MKNYRLIYLSKWFVLTFLSFALIQCNTQGQKSNEENRKSSSEFEPDVDIELTATPRQIQLLPGEKTKVYSYESKLIKGDDDNLEQLSNTYLGPIIKVEPEQKIRVRFKNQLPDESIIHWHGLHISPEMDGHPMYAINKGEEYVYEFTVNNRPGTYWFHP
ncbi:MAG: multicopper oxidase domain-containing protein, partial [Bacteroidota bacterium]